MNKGEVIRNTERKEMLRMSSHKGRFTVDMDITKDANDKYFTNVRVISWHINGTPRNIVIDDYYDLLELKGFLDRIVSEHDNMQSRIPNGKGILWEKS